jgi:hypothetical protein
MKIFLRIAIFFLTHALFAGMGIFFPVTTQGQGLYNQSSLYNNGVDMHVDGDILNTGLLINHGLVAFTRDWDNPGDYQGEGTIEADGSAPQKIIHHGQKINNLAIDGWGTKFIKGKLTVTGELNLKEGLVTVTDNDELMLTSDVTVSGGSADSYVEGAITTVGTGYKFFPIGKNGNYAPIKFLEVKGSSAIYSMEVYENAPLITIDNVIVKNGLYWQRRDLVGNFGGSAVAVTYDPSHFIDVGKMILVTGTDWDSPFMAVNDVRQSPDDELTTSTQIMSPILMLGETTETWAVADFYFSTALSPNAANPDNRSVKIFGQRLGEIDFHFEVFNRWGFAVFESTSLQEMSTNGWDGHSLTGQELASGAYPYKLTATDKTGRRLEKKGVISILR